MLDTIQLLILPNKPVTFYNASNHMSRCFRFLESQSRFLNLFINPTLVLRGMLTCNLIVDTIVYFHLS